MNLVREGRGVGRHHCQQIKTEVLQIGFCPHLIVINCVIVKQDHMAKVRPKL